MSKYTLSNKAADDLANIYQYTFSDFGEALADRYLNELDSCFIQLAETPSLARKVSDIRQDYFHYLFNKHAVYFKCRDNDIYIVRVLHQHMKYELHLIS